jgi:hypothetical protein
VLSEGPIQVVRTNGFFSESCLLPHRHSFYMLYWTTAGTGLHLILSDEQIERQISLGLALLIEHNNV